MILIRRTEMGKGVLILLGWFCCLGESQRTSSCPNDPGSTGYLTIGDIVLDIQEEVARIEGGEDPVPPYNYPICPQTTLLFNAEDLSIAPTLDKSFFTCGEDGLGTGCEIRGGTTQFTVNEENLVSGSILESNFTVTFRGFVFAGFSETSIEITGGQDTVSITFEDCEFSVSLYTPESLIGLRLI